MELLIYFIAFMGVIFWIGLFVQDADPKEDPIQSGLKKIADGQSETFGAIGKSVTNTVESYKYKKKFAKGELLTGKFILQVDISGKEWEAHINYRGGINSFDIDFVGPLESKVDSWEILTQSEKYSLHSQIQDHIYEMRLKAGLSKR
jgi:hypothetical protein